LASLPVSSLLVRSLPHPDRKSSLPIVAFDPKGRLIVSGYPSGIVQMLDPTTGKEVHTIETPRGYRGSFNYMQLSQDRKTLFVALDDSKFEPLRVGEKKSWYRRYRGETRIYDMETGKIKKVLRTDPPRGVILIAISPNATKLASMEYTSGPSADFDKLRAMYLWDIPTGKTIKLRDGYGDPRFAPDGKLLYITVNDRNRKSGVVYVYAADTGKEVARLESRDSEWISFVFSPDGKRATGSAIDAKTKKPVVRLFQLPNMEVKEDLSADIPSDVRFSHLTFAPDGERLVAVAKNVVHMWNLKNRKTAKLWRLDTPGRVFRLNFAADGRRLAAATWHIPPELQNARDEVVTPQDYPQPRMFLIDADHEKYQTFVCPHGWWGQPAFSPDGKWLAVGGAGATHLFDLKAK
jgi:WD40 repeat protein